MDIDDPHLHLEDSRRLQISSNLRERRIRPGPRQAGIAVVFGRRLGGIFADQLVGGLLVRDDEREFRHRRLQLGADRAKPPYGRGRVDLGLGLDGEAGEFVQKLIVNTKFPGLPQVEGQLPDRRLGRIMGLGQELLHPRLELFLEIALLTGRPGEKGDPRLVERRR